VRLRAIFDDLDAASARDIHDFRHVGRPAGKVNRDDRSCPLGEDGRDRLRSDVAALGIDIGENGSRSDEHCARCRGDERARRDDHLIARTDAEGAQCELEGYRPVRERDRAAPAESLGTGLLEREHVWPGPLIDAAGAQHRGDGSDFVIAVEGPTFVRSQVENLGSARAFRSSRRGCSDFERLGQQYAPLASDWIDFASYWMKAVPAFAPAINRSQYLARSGEVRERSRMDVYRRATELMEAEVGDELVALQPDLGLCFGFNSVATDVWKELETPKSFDQLKEQILAGYDVDEQQCATELNELLSNMADLGLIGVQNDAS
jgi:Coenzyme PQQ synthesis protein D (PqqD)